MLRDSIELISPSVVQFAVSSGDSQSRGVLGSGVILDEEGHVATCAHVLRDAGSLIKEGCSVQIGLGFPNIEQVDRDVRAEFTMFGAKLIGVDDAKDIAILKLTPNPFEVRPKSSIRFEGEEPRELPCVAAPTDSSRPFDGMPIATSGYPLNSANMVTTSGHIASAWNSEELEVQDPSTRQLLKVNEDFYLGDISVNPGNSGGPVYRVADGVVIGITSAYRPAPVRVTTRPATAGEVELKQKEVAEYWQNSGLALIAPIGGILDLMASS